VELANKKRMIRDHGQKKKYYHGCIGWNARMGGFQCAVLSVKLKHLPVWNEARRKNAELFNTLLNGSDAIITPKEMGCAKHDYHIYAVRAQNGDALIAKLGKRRELRHSLPRADPSAERLSAPWVKNG
jgi:dTDP-4-amino-4,6-dideoxygalactose transaminase